MSVNVASVEPTGEKGTFVKVVQRYIPVLQTDRPAYGVVSFGTEIVVALSDKAPVELVRPLEDELNTRVGSALQGAIQSHHYVERLTHEYLHMQVVWGNVRYDKVSQKWRWTGEPNR